MKTYNTSLFIFRRALRLHDNIGLINALKLSTLVIPIFIFTPEQLVHNNYKSDNCVQFMIQSLIDLNKELRKKGSRLYYFFGTPNKIVDTLLKNNDRIDAVFVNMDYTPYSTTRDNTLKQVCDNYDIDFDSYEDILLNPVKSILTKSGNVYQKFTPYFNAAKKKKVSGVIKIHSRNYYRARLPKVFNGNIHKFYKKNSNLAVHGGRHLALQILANIKDFKNYNKERNILDLETTRLSACIKFGCVSIREVYHAFKTKLGSRNDLIKQLYWRDFYYNISYEWPHIFKSSMIILNGLTIVHILINGKMVTLDSLLLMLL